MNIQIGIYLAFGWTAEEMAAHLGCSTSNISARKSNTRHRSLIDTVAEYTNIGVKRLTSERILKAEEDFKERKNRLHSKGYEVIEKAIDSTLGDETRGIKPSAVEPVHLRAAEMAIERNEGRPLDRKAILHRNDNEGHAQLDEEDLKGILGELEETNRLRRSSLLLTDGTQDADLVLTGG